MRPISIAARPISPADLRALGAWLRRGPRLTMGPQVQAFERALARRLGRRFAVMVNSGSSANLLMAWAARLQWDVRRVAVPAIGWATTLAPFLQLQGLEPVLVDVGRRTWGMDARTLQDAARRQPLDAAVVVHVLGVPADDREAIQAVARRGRLRILEDACAALGSSPCGRFGGLATLSFYWGHHLSTIEGGAVLTDEPESDRVLRALRAHGWGSDWPETVQERMRRAHGFSRFDWRFIFHLPGFNVRPTEIQGFLGRRQLRRLDGRVAARRRLGARYRQLLAESAWRPQCADGGGMAPAPIALGIMAPHPAARDRALATLARAGVETRPVGGGNLGRQPFWPDRPSPLPVADEIGRLGFQVPCHQDMTLGEVDRICALLRRIGP